MSREATPGHGPEFRLAEKPTLDRLVGLGYAYLHPDEHDEHRDGENHVILRPILIEAVQRLNGVSEEVPRATYSDLLNITDNEAWTNLLRGNYSRNIPGEPTKKTIHLIDFLHPENNTYTVTNQLYIKAQKSHIPDVVVYVNGIPLVVVEAKSPISGKDKSGEGFDQIKQYERDIPRLFYSNLFSIVTDGVHLYYGTTGAPLRHWSYWKDPWPRTDDDFGGDALAKGLWCLLEPARLLDMLAHLVIFEKRPQGVIKKMCHYQQFRAVNKIVDRVAEGKHRKGLIWHTQGSGKSLTMVFATLKLKTHRTLVSRELESPNILVLTDRIDLDDQISKTFEACGLPNPVQIESIGDLHKLIRSGSNGLTLLATIFKFEGSRKPIPNSENWIVLVDECHRTQEKDLGAFLRATLPEARFFGFTGTPIKKNDKDTYANFGVEGEGYLDRYSIDDAVADGATVPIHYTSRKTEWQIDAAKLDVLFDQWFADLPDEKIAQIKKRGVSINDLAKHPQRVNLIAYDLWTHFKGYAEPDGFKAQIVAIDREAVILYKRALDKVIAEDLQQQGCSPEEAQRQAEQMSTCVYSASQEDGKPSEDPYTEALRADLRKYYLDHEAEKEAKANFGEKGNPLRFLIVCNKLLTGFDAPMESVMYLDNPLTEHNLLQAIARTNRVEEHKPNGLIVDYIGVSRKLDEALSTYRQEDIKNAMRDVEELRSQLRAAHAEVMALMKGIKRGTRDLKAEYDALIQALGSEDAWFTFRRKGKGFIQAYSALSPDPAVLDYREDLKWVAGFIFYATQVFEKNESLDHRHYSEKIRQMLEEHLEVTGLSVVCKLRHITDPEFWQDFRKEQEPQDLRRAAIRKSTELKRITYEKKLDNPLQYGSFSERVLEAIKRFEQGQMEAAELLKEMEQIARDLQEEVHAYQDSGMNERAYGIYKILEAFRAALAEGEGGNGGGGNGDGEDRLEELAQEIDGVYASDETAPVGWHLKEQLRKDIRGMVRRIVYPSGLENWKDIPVRVEEFALKHYIKT
ncbi:MAG: type I restriction endonuclease subunit R [Phycisphaerales bacterium]|nr:type I restriction endonuclease subunit R [Phycisphaerales bacterium]